MGGAWQIDMSSQSANPGPRSSAQLLAALGDASSRLGMLEAYERDSAEGIAALTAEVTLLARSVLQTLDALEKSDEPADEGFADEPETWVGFRPPVAAEPARIQDVCFVASFELGRVLQTLEREAEDEPRAIAAETGLRKLHRILGAVLGSAERLSGSALPATEPLRRRARAELDSSLAVRRLYVAFRRSLRRPRDNTREGVLEALRYAAGGLATIAASPHYAAVRLSDRALLRRQRERLLDWAHAGKPTQAGVQLLEDIFTCADLLRDINRRQELREHDRSLMRELVGDTTRAREEWLVKLERLAGLDDTLDALTAELQKSSGSGPVLDIVVRLSLLLD
jgi:hypothetical protein